MLGLASCSRLFLSHDSRLTPRYATSATINPYSALIHNYFGQETSPFPAVHLTVDTELTASGDGLGVKGYSSLPLSAAVNPKPENCVFLPVPVGIKFAPSERAGCEFGFFSVIWVMRKVAGCEVVWRWLFRQARSAV